MGTSPLPQKGWSPQFSAHVYRGQTAASIKMPLGTEVGLGLHDTVFDVDQLPAEQGNTHPTQFLTYVYCGQMGRWMKTLLGTEVDLSPGHIVLDGVPLPTPAKGAPPLFLAHVYCGHGRPSQLLLSSRFNMAPRLK